MNVELDLNFDAENAPDVEYYSCTGKDYHDPEHCVLSANGSRIMTGGAPCETLNKWEVGYTIEKVRWQNAQLNPFQLQKDQFMLAGMIDGLREIVLERFDIPQKEYDEICTKWIYRSMVSTRGILEQQQARSRIALPGDGIFGPNGRPM